MIIARHCIKKVGHVGYFLFQLVAINIGAGLFALIGIFTAATGAIALCAYRNPEPTDTILTIMVLLGALSGASFFFGVVDWLPGDKRKRRKPRWLRVASVILPLMCIITLTATVKYCIYSTVAVRAELDESVIGTLALSGISSLASFGQYALATYIVYWKIRTDPLKQKQRSDLAQVASTTPINVFPMATKEMTK